REITDPRLRARTLVHLGTVYRRLHRTVKALATYELALAVASRSSELRLAAQSYMGVAVALYDAGELDGAIGNYQRALGLLERVSDTAVELSVMQSLATVQFEHGDMNAARETVDRCSQRAALAGDARVGAIVDVLRARITLEEGDSEYALRLAESAEARLAELGDHRQQADALRVAAAAAHTRGDFASSDQAYRKAKEIPKVGSSVSEAIEQIVATGRSKRHEELQAAVPPGLLTLLRVPGVGPATARTIYDHLKITTIEELEEAAKDHRLQQLPKIQA